MSTQYKTIAVKVDLNLSLLGSPTAYHEITITSGQTKSNQVLHLKGHSIVGVIFDDDVGSSVTLTANVGVVNELPSGNSLGPQPEGTFSVAMANNTSPSVAPASGLPGWEFVEFVVNADPAANITFFIVTKAL